MDVQTAYDRITATGIMSAIRGDFPPETALRVCETLVNAGVNILEFTTNSVQPFEAMQAVKAHFGDDAVVGMGTILDPDLCQRALDLGADFVVAPSLDVRVIALAHQYNTLAVPGVITPTEAVVADQAGAKLVKIYPIGALGVEYFKAVRTPLDHIKFCCNGAMSDANVGEFLQAGAVACGVAAWLSGNGSMALELIDQRARKLISIVQDVRSGAFAPQKV
jgi:2-dehydro-3-deoxyphosphogluconate aldolase / (4S)-4-hydroxy-2-oxoglutarate aldolase